MPRRPPPQRQPPPFDPPDRDSLLYGDLHPEHAANLRALRSHWKWAAFSQFFYTFAPLLALPDIALADIEDDLARPRSLYLPRVIQRLLITLTQDRKINVDNWQSALRKQYYKRLPHANPLGPEPQVVYSDVEDDDAERDDAPDDTATRSSDPPEQLPDTPAEPLPEHAPSSIPEPEIATPAASISAPEQSKRESKRKSKKKGKVGSRAQSRGAANGEVIVPIEEGDSKDWLELELLEKLDSLHLLTEWQFQNTHRLRQLMKDDDESALWRIEPIGYDAKTNAYWLIGPDRLWIQRAPPKPPRSAKRKRASAKPKAAKASSSKVVPEDSDVDDDLPPSSKRKRVQRITRTSAVHSDPPPVTPSRSRAAKVQANKKLDAQAKELAEFQRQAVASAKTRATRQASASAQKRAVFGTRASARLRGSTRNDDEWQEIPDEWLKASSAEESDDGNENVNDEVNEHEDNGNADADGDDSSELTELSDSSEEEKPPAPSGTRKRGGAKVNGTAKAKKVEPKVEEDALPEEVPEEARPLPSDFVEWELICFTLYDWEHIADQFAKATQYLEKALYKVLSQSIVPAVTADLKEVERQRKVEDALVRRKRSSRIALREVEKEEARLAEMKHAGDAEKEARAKRAEARAQKEQAEREKREHAREQRRIEREEREERARRKEERSQKTTVCQWCLAVLAPNGNISHVMTMLIWLQVVHVETGSLNSFTVQVVATPSKIDACPMAASSRTCLQNSNATRNLTLMFKNLIRLQDIPLCNIKCTVSPPLICDTLSLRTLANVVSSTLALIKARMPSIPIRNHLSTNPRLQMAIRNTHKTSATCMPPQVLSGLRTPVYRMGILPPQTCMLAISRRFLFLKGLLSMMSPPCRLFISQPFCDDTDGDVLSVNGSGAVCACPLGSTTAVNLLDAMYILTRLTWEEAGIRTAAYSQAAGFERIRSLIRTVSVSSATSSASGTSLGRMATPERDSDTTVDDAAAALRWDQEQDELDIKAVDRELYSYEHDLQCPRRTDSDGNDDLMVDPGFDLCNFWELYEPAYPTLHRIALDVLPAQASAVPCERVFSSSKATDAVRRGRLSPKLMESLQILKFLYRSQREEPLDFSKGLQSLPSDLEPKVTAQTMTSYAGEGRLDELDLLIIESEADQLPPDPIDSDFVLPTVADGDDDW
ncbi:hypothetical protein EUX98_g9416 [Antrodiella citrinella]|uniref:HAT C-terminal dimerisation domain-containing protein n=1 Tax=Antrodiella citrinella TaxID=2447956 RepID=A0A4S4LU13_9APHY|nr:hypothetical protein EUX98_g9416 [Antrodiella citrinella]